jgi:AraC-like DNA-binding protein
VPDSVLVGLTVSRAERPNALEEAVQRNALQHSAVDLAHAAGEVIAGRIGEHGIVLLSSQRRRLVGLSERLAVAARKNHGLSLHFGTADGPAASLPMTYQAALAAAETALVRGERTLPGRSSDARESTALFRLREELGRAVQERPDALAARFDRYLEVVAARCGYRVDAARGHLEAGLERICEPLVRSGALDERSHIAMRNALERAADDARTMGDVFTAYRAAMADISAAVQSPMQARHDRGLRGALEHIHRHYMEPVRLAHVARLSGISRAHFCRLFRKREGMTFEQYLFGLRIERAKQLLASTALPVVRVAELSGFNSAQYFCRAFRRALGASPLGYRGEPARQPGTISKRRKYNPPRPDPG